MEHFYGNIHGHVVTDEHLEERQQWLKTLSPAFLSTCQPLEITAFTLRRQEPHDRWTTRIGGLPAWRRDVLWPDCAKCGEQLAFAAQLDFRNTVLRKSVPGDLLIFHYCFACRPWWKGDGAAEITWSEETDSSMLIEEEIIPEDLEGFEHGPFYGEAAETIDYSGWLAVGAEPNDSVIWDLLFRGTKIGGHIPFHDDECPDDSSGRRMLYLGCLDSTVAKDVPKLNDGIRRPACGDLELGDAGCIHFWGQYVNGTFEMNWSLESG